MDSADVWRCQIWSSSLDYSVGLDSNHRYSPFLKGPENRTPMCAHTHNTHTQTHIVSVGAGCQRQGGRCYSNEPEEKADTTVHPPDSNTVVLLWIRGPVGGYVWRQNTPPRWSNISYHGNSAPAFSLSLSLWKRIEAFFSSFSLLLPFSLLFLLPFFDQKRYNVIE